MKIGLVRRGYSSTGGAETYLLRLGGALQQAGHELVLFSDEQWPVEAFEAERLQPTQIVLEARSPRLFADAVRAARPQVACDFLLSLERVWACDVYRAGDGVHGEWLRRRAAREPFWKPFFRKLQRKHTELLALERALFTGGARAIIANSRMVKDEITAHFGTAAERIHVVHNGVPAWSAEPGERARKRAELGLNEGDYAVLFAGSGWERKGLRYAIAAMDSVPGTLLIAGRGKTRARSERARFLGPQDRSAMHALLAAADAFVLPTLYEPFSNACLEALAAGLPVITTRANGFAEIIEPGVEGEVIADPADTAALARALAAWADPAKRAAIRAQLLGKGAAYSIEANVRRTLEVIERCSR